jgi:hypothetical protein
MYLVGWLTKDAVLHTNAINRTSDITVDAWSNLTALPATATGGMYNIYDSGDDTNNEYYDLREEGSSRESKWCSCANYAFAASKCDGSQVVEAILEGTGTPATFYETGYFTEDSEIIGPFPTFKPQVS